MNFLHHLYFRRVRWIEWIHTSFTAELLWDVGSECNSFDTIHYRPSINLLHQSRGRKIQNVQKYNMMYVDNALYFIMTLLQLVTREEYKNHYCHVCYKPFAFFTCSFTCIIHSFQLTVIMSLNCRNEYCFVLNEYYEGRIRIMFVACCVLVFIYVRGLMTQIW